RVAVVLGLLGPDLALGEVVRQLAQRLLLLRQVEGQPERHRAVLLGGRHQKKMDWRRMARPMSPLTLSFPVMNAICGLRRPLTIESQSSSPAVMVMLGASAWPSTTEQAPSAMSACHWPPPSPAMSNW